MRMRVLTQGSKPSVVVEVFCDTELLTQLLKDDELDYKEVLICLANAVNQIKINMERAMKKAGSNG